MFFVLFFFFFQAEDGIRDYKVTGVQTCALPISRNVGRSVSGADSGAGIFWLTPTDMPGLMPHVTTGSIAAPSRRATSSNLAPGSVATDFHHVAARSNAPSFGA